MPEIPQPRRLAGPTFQDPVDDAVLDRHVPPERLAPEARAVQDVLRAAGEPATDAELTGQAAALAAFARIVGVSSPSPRSRRLRRPAMLSTLLGAKLAVAAAASAATLGGAAAAAYTGSLPPGLQNFAHHTIGAPSADSGGTDSVDASASDSTGDPESTDAATGVTAPTVTPTATPVGPDATGPAAVGLCRAYAAHQAHGGTQAANSVAFANLAAAAGGVDNIGTYCAGIAKPGNSGSHPTGKPTSQPSHPTGKPTSHPSHPSSSSHPTGKPTSHPSHPSSTSHPTGKPTSHPSHPTGH